MKIAILGGTGNEGFGLGYRWAAAGHEIIIGSRKTEKGENAAADMKKRLPEGIISTRNSEANFNDARRPHYDSLFARIDGDWAGDSERLRGGLAYHITPNMSLDAILVSP